MNSTDHAFGTNLENGTSGSGVVVKWMIPQDNSTDTSHQVSREIIINMNMYGLPVIILIGILGNTTSLIVFSFTHLRHQSSSVYMAFLNFADCLFLFCLIVPQLEWYHIFLMRISGICQIVIYLSYVSAFLSVWTVVSFTVERVIAVYFPLKRLIYCTRKREKYVVVILFFGALVLYSFTLVTNGVQLLNNQNECMYFIQYHSLVYYSSLLDTIFTMIVPSVLIIVLNFLIIIKMWTHLRTTSRDSYSPDTVGVPAGEETMPRLACHQTRGISDEERQLLEKARRPHVTGEEDQRPGTDITTEDSTQLHCNGQARTDPCLCCRSPTSPPAHGAAASPVARAAGNRSPMRTAAHGIRSSHTNSRAQVTQMKTTRTLLIISTLFVVFNLPSHTFRVWVILYPPREVPSENLLLGQLFFQFLYYLNFSSNIFLYCACSQMFRKELKALLKKLWQMIVRR